PRLRPERRHVLDDRWLRRHREALGDGDAAAAWIRVPERPEPGGDGAFYARRHAPRRPLRRRDGLRLADHGLGVDRARVHGGRAESHARGVAAVRPAPALRTGLRLTANRIK